MLHVSKIDDGSLDWIEEEGKDFGTFWRFVKEGECFVEERSGDGIEDRGG